MTMSLQSYIIVTFALLRIYLVHLSDWFDYQLSRYVGCRISVVQGPWLPAGLSCVPWHRRVSSVVH